MLVVILTSAESVLFALHDASPPRETDGLWTLLLNSAWSWWVFVDRRRRGISRPFEFDALVFFAWPVVVPYYLLKSKASRTTWATAAIWFFYSAPFLIAAVVYGLLA